MQDIEKDIIRKASRGDLRAFEEIYTKSSAYVYGLALWTLNKIEDAQEVTQDVYLQLHRKLPTFRFDSTFKTWIYRITINTAINARLKRSREYEKMNMLEQDVTHQPLSADNVLLRINQEDANARLEKLLRGLTVDQRTCVTLREIDQLSYQEIAEILNININTVRTRIKRAREALLSLSNSDER